MKPAFPPLACPLDGAPLTRDERSWRCPSGHSFDIAAQDYAHLLPVQFKRSRDPGDSKEMVASRRNFLNAGAYAGIARAVAEATLAGVADGARLACLDAGCGEGYYLRELATLNGGRVRLQRIGLDISKWAVLAAARQERGPTWVVGSNARLPVLPATLDRVLCLFGFPVYAEFARVLRPAGRLLQVDAGPDHLRELREVLYPSLKPPRAELSVAPAGFVMEGVETVRYPLALEGAERIRDLLAMTPHLHRATPEGRARALALTEVTVTVDVRLARLLRTDA